MVAGSTGGISSDCTSCTTSASNLFGQLRRNGRSWKVFAESMPSNCSSTGTSRYVKRHNPPTYFPKLAADCARWDVPMGSAPGGRFATALANGWLPAFTMVVPDMCNDMHDCSIATGDVWLSKWIPRIAATADYRLGHTVVLLTWDEGEGRATPARSTALPISPTRAVTSGAGAVGHHARRHLVGRAVLALLAASHDRGAAGDADVPLGRAATSTSMRGAFGL